VNGRELAVVQGWADTRATLRAWNRAPLRIVWRWLRLSLVISVGLLAAVYAIALLSTPDATRLVLPGVTRPAGLGDVFAVFWRNLLVLALHALACLAGFIAKSSLPVEAESYTGWWRRVHDHAGPAAIAFVTAATVFSLVTQAFVLGGGLATLAAQFGISPLALLSTVSLHAVPELCALFLPLAAWLVAARAGDWQELMAATFATSALALPVLALSAVVEVYVTPELILSLHFV
jgi:hypothetical protein